MAEWTHLSLFSGIGGIDLAAHWAGFRTVAFVEKDPFCQKVLAKNFPGIPIYEDIKTFDAGPLRGVDLVSGGFPCQPFSTGGKRRGKGDHRFLWPEMLRVVRECRPAWVVGENVAHFVRMALDDCVSELGTEGYTGRPYVVPACGVGAHHRRDRVFIVAHSDEVGRQTRVDPVRKGRDRKDADRHVPPIQPARERRLPEPWAADPDSGWGVYLSKCRRMADGLPSRMDERRTAALGNAVVPAQVYPILKAIADCLSSEETCQE